MSKDKLVTPSCLANEAKHKLTEDAKNVILELIKELEEKPYRIPLLVIGKLELDSFVFESDIVRFTLRLRPNDWRMRDKNHYIYCSVAHHMWKHYDFDVDSM